jgi:transcriptional regulator with XRE-family HTH domain
MPTKKTRLTSAQIRAARALLNWSMRQLSEKSGVSQSAISRAERARGHPTMHEHGLSAIKATLEQFGVEFLGDAGVCMRSSAQGEQSGRQPYLFV